MAIPFLVSTFPRKKKRERPRLRSIMIFLVQKKSGQKKGGVASLEQKNRKTKGVKVSNMCLVLSLTRERDSCQQVWALSCPWPRTLLSKKENSTVSQLK